ncbi:MAG TPA: hypothetical protein VH120_17545 [Gemmataceae bacterium]|jgi:hypothetical protein|nr:hypothetical protein [Gemmataceae bacterium]
MARRLLRVFPTAEYEEAPPTESRVRIRLGELLPLVAMAQRMHFVWLQDFLDDEVQVTSDLYEVLQAFRSCRPSA